MSKILPVVNTLLATWPLVDPHSYQQAQRKIFSYTRRVSVDDIDVSRPVFVNGVYISGGSKDEVIEALHQFDDGTYGPVGYYGSVFYSKYYNFDYIYYDVIKWDEEGKVLHGVNSNIGTFSASATDDVFQLDYAKPVPNMTGLEKLEGGTLSYITKSDGQGLVTSASYSKMLNQKSFKLLTTAKSSQATPVPQYKNKTYGVFSLAPGETLLIKGNHSAYRHLLHAIPPYDWVKGKLQQGQDVLDTEWAAVFQTPLMPQFAFNNLRYYSYDQLCKFDNIGSTSMGAATGRRHICVTALDEDCVAIVIGSPNVAYSVRS